MSTFIRCTRIANDLKQTTRAWPAATTDAMDELDSDDEAGTSSVPAVPKMSVGEARAASETASNKMAAATSASAAATKKAAQLKFESERAKKIAKADEEAIADAPELKQAAIEIATQAEAAAATIEEGLEMVAQSAAAAKEEADKAARFAAGARRAGAAWATNATRKAKQLENDWLDAERAAEEGL